MRVAPLATLALAVALAFPAATADDVHARNVAYLWSVIGEHDPATQVTFPDGHATTLGAAVDEAAARASLRGVDLAGLAAGAAPDALGIHLGDVWIVELGLGPCDAGMLGPGSPVFIPLDPQLWLYVGGTGTLATSHGHYTMMISWTAKTSETRFDTAGFTALGAQDFYCFEFGGSHLAFPFVDGYAWFNPEAEP